MEGEDSPHQTAIVVRSNRVLIHEHHPTMTLTGRRKLHQDRWNRLLIVGEQGQPLFMSRQKEQRVRRTAKIPFPPMMHTLDDARIPGLHLLCDDRGDVFVDQKREHQTSDLSSGVSGGKVNRSSPGNICFKRVYPKSFSAMA